MYDVWGKTSFSCNHCWFACHVENIFYDTLKWFSLRANWVVCEYCRTLYLLALQDQYICTRSWMNASVGPIMIDKSFFFSGIHFEQALFVPNQSQYNKLGSLASPPSEREEIDLSWQLSLQRVWESLPHNNDGCSKLHCETVFSCQHLFSYWNYISPLSWRWDVEFYENDAGLNGANSRRASSVFESLPLAIQWLRETAQQNQTTQFQVKAFATVL